MKPINYQSMTDRELSLVLRDSQREIRRRTSAAASDAGAIIRGHEMAKRAITIAACDSHSIAFIGPNGCGKTMLRALALKLGVGESFEATICPCGHRNDPRVACNCTVPQIKRHVAKWPLADMMVEVPAIPARELEGRHTGTTAAQMREHIESAATSAEWKPCNDCIVLLRASINELGISAAEVEVIKSVACTIARLDGEAIVGPSHLCEAISYRSITHHH